MKKFITLLAFLIGTQFSNAQDISEHAAGLRIGDGGGFGVELSYQKSLGIENRFEIDLGLRNGRSFNSFRLTGLYQWVLPIADSFNWYYGGGAGFGSVNFDSEIIDIDSGGFFLFLAGMVGIEYNFDFPLVVSLDFRPDLNIIGGGGFDNIFNTNFALGVRYQF